RNFLNKSSYRLSQVSSRPLFNKLANDHYAKGDQEIDIVPY
ncbi:12837_t:CDS:2, partial [Acaulospora morrowiae]